MEVQELTPSLVYGLSAEQVEAITLAYQQTYLDGGYVSGKAALAEALGQTLDDLDLELVEDAARHKSPHVDFHRAILWAYLAYRYPRSLVPVQLAALTRPWTAR